MKEKTKYALVNAHLNTAIELLELAQAQLGRAAAMGANVADVMKAIVDILRVTHLVRNWAKNDWVAQLKREETDESESTI